MKSNAPTIKTDAAVKRGNVSNKAVSNDKREKEFSQFNHFKDDHLTELDKIANNTSENTLQRIANPEGREQPIQPKPNKTGLPDNLKTGVTQLKPSVSQVVQLNGPAWKKSTEVVHTSAISDAIDAFISNYENVQQGELDPEVGFPDLEVYYEANTKETDEAAPLLIKVKEKNKNAVKRVAEEVLSEIVAQAKTSDGRRKIVRQIGPGGIAAYIEDSILARVLPYMDVSLKSLVPMGKFRKNEESIMGFVEGMTDVVYNSCGMAIEVLSGTLATPLVATGGGAYKGGFAAASVRRQGGTKEQAAAAATVTAAAETGQAMIPLAGGAWGIAGGVKGMAKSSRIRARIKGLVSGVGGGSDTLKERPATMGDERVVGLIDERIEHAYSLLEKAEREQGLEKEVAKLRKAIEWLLRQREKSSNRFKKSSGKGKRPLLASAAGAGYSSDQEGDLE